MADKADDIEDTAAPEQHTAPEAGKPLTENEAVDSIADLLGDDLEETPDPKAAKVDEEGETASKDPLGDDEEDVDADKGDDKDDGSQDEKATAGKYVSPQAKYKLADGTEITVGELARNNLYQRDYSKKTEEVARDREAVTKEKAEVAELSRTLSEERQFLIWFAENNTPKPPTPPELSPAQDPIGHLTYNEELRKYQAFAEAYRSFKQGQEAEDKRKAGETEQQAKERVAKEVSTLFTKLKIDPQKEPAKAKAFFEALEQGAQKHYGLQADQIATLIKSDHQAALVLRDAIRYRNGKAEAPKVQEKLKTVPVMRRAPTARQAPNQQQDRVVRASGEKLRNSGRFDDGVAAIEALIS